MTQHPTPTGSSLDFNATTVARVPADAGTPERITALDHAPEWLRQLAAAINARLPEAEAEHWRGLMQATLPAAVDGRELWHCIHVQHLNRLESILSILGKHAVDSGADNAARHANVAVDIMRGCHKAELRGDDYPTDWIDTARDTAEDALGMVAGNHSHAADSVRAAVSYVLNATVCAAWSCDYAGDEYPHGANEASTVVHAEASAAASLSPLDRLPLAGNTNVMLGNAKRRAETLGWKRHAADLWVGVCQ